MSRGPTTAREAALAHLAEFGTVTLMQIVDDSGIDKCTVSAALRTMNRGSVRIPQVIYIKKWTQVHEGSKRYPRAVYALGVLPDAGRPKPNTRANRVRYVQSKTRRLTTNFVFNLANSVRM